MSPLHKALVFSIAVAAHSVLAEDAAPCRKLVFSEYCLGGSTESLDLTPVDGLANLYTDNSGQAHTRLEVVAARLVSIERRLQPGGWREYDRWRKRLERVYRSGDDTSTFPRYAASRSSKLNAIRSGRGSARVDWDQGEWLLSLIWREPDAIHLRYTVIDQVNDTLQIDDL